RLLAAATAGAPPAGWAHKRQPVRIVLDPDEQPAHKGALCAASAGFNLHAATRVAANDKEARERLCRYILRPPFANDRLSILDDGNVRLEFKKPWSDGTSSIDLAPLAFLARLSALVPPETPPESEAGYYDVVVPREDHPARPPEIR
ncbi:MAG: transposase, partial [Thermoanaerobaculaceae bacterium]|nr:transposase [Thermoanaerobaculaceae bacterium]